jgi:hypothetical protein
MGWKAPESPGLYGLTPGNSGRKTTGIAVKAGCNRELNGEIPISGNNAESDFSIGVSDNKGK